MLGRVSKTLGVAFRTGLAAFGTESKTFLRPLVLGLALSLQRLGITSKTHLAVLQASSLVFGKISRISLLMSAKQ